MTDDNNSNCTRIADVLREIHALDWTPDAAYPKSGRSVKYVTTAKIKRQITPVLDKHGLRIQMTMADAPTIDGNCATVRYDACITDGISEHIPATIYAEGNNDPGKRILTSMTNAYRIYTLMAFGIIDGMEDEAPTASASESGSHIRPMAEQPEEPAVIGPQGTTTPEEVSKTDPLSGLFRRAVESAYRSIMASQQVPQEIREDARRRYEAISDDQDAERFIAWKREVIQ